MRRIVLGLFVAIAASTACGDASAQSYPQRPIRLIIPFPPAGATDILGRTLAQKLGEALNTQVVVENKPGAGGALGSTEAARAAADGYTLVMATTSTHSVNPALNPKIAYNVERDFAPVVWLANSANILIASPALPANNVRELIAHAKAHPGTVNYASSGNGTIIHLTAELFASMAGVKLVHVPYKGTALSIPDLISGQVSILFDNIVSAMPHIKGGKVKTLGVTSAQRSPLVPDIPTVSESGLPGFVSDAYFGVFAPSGTPRDVVLRLNAEINKLLATPDFRERLAAFGAEPAGGDPERFAAHVRTETAKWAKVIADAGVKAD